MLKITYVTVSVNHNIYEDSAKLYGLFAIRMVV